jgi:hypothetical protein
VTTHSNGFEVIGAIKVKWLARGGARGFLGKPLENEQKWAMGPTRRGAWSVSPGVIARHPDTGVAFEVHGAILERWRAVAMSGSDSPSPTSRLHHRYLERESSLSLHPAATTTSAPCTWPASPTRRSIGTLTWQVGRTRYSGRSSGSTTHEAGPSRSGKVRSAHKAA